MVKRFGLLVLLGVFCVPGMTSHADAKSSRNRWHFPATPYFWFASFDGGMTLDGGSGPENVSFSDLFESLSWGFTAHVEAKKREVSWIFDFNYRNFRPEEGEFFADIDTWVTEAAFGYEIIRSLEGIVGGRYNSLNIEAKKSGFFFGNASENWIDPIVGTRYTWKFKKDWAFVGRGDVGGFGAGSDLSWSAVATAAYRVNNTSFVFGYKIQGVDYKTGSGSDRFEYDVKTSGVGVGLTFHL